jgi:hypothetical protein
VGGAAVETDGEGLGGGAEGGVEATVAGAGAGASGCAGGGASMVAGVRRIARDGEERGVYRQNG